MIKGFALYALAIALTLAFVLLVNIGFAAIGEPRSKWLVCDILGIDVCESDA